MLENKKLNMVISLLIAIALWAFVIGEVNPEATRSYRDIPIKLMNEEILEQNDMAVYSVSQRTLNVTLTGTRSEINKIDTKDIIATADLSNAVMGENQLRVDLKIPSKVEIESQSINKLIVTVESRVSKEIPVEVSYEGAFTGEEEPITVAQNPEVITVYGAETTVGMVTAAKATVEENKITHDSQELQCRLIAVNSAGQRVYNVDLSQNSVVITSELAKLKTVPLHIPIEGEDHDGVERTVTKPEEITIKGKAADLDKITRITAEPVYLDGVMASTNIPVVPVLPEGVAVSKESDNLMVTVQVTKIGTKIIELDSSKISFTGLGDGLSVESADAVIELNITGNESLIENLTEADVVLQADLSNLKTGKYKVALQASLHDDVGTVTVNPKKITVTIKAESGETDTDETLDDSNDDNHDNNDQNDNNEE